MILVDTSVWIDHFQKTIPALTAALESEDVVVHPFVIGELACGVLRRRAEILHLLSLLPASILASDAEALRFIELHRLMGKGIGYMDVHLLASVILRETTRLWTHDKRLGAIAGRLRIGYES
ncbi:MAG TPA: PIN domain-containing protein [Thermoanaerobaculia bacterium]|nr:PIN domain-containing protein [Thermoanaerobaculia bacterium]